MKRYFIYIYIYIYIIEIYEFLCAHLMTIIFLIFRAINVFRVPLLRRTDRRMDDGKVDSSSFFRVLHARAHLLASFPHLRHAPVPSRHSTLNAGRPFYAAYSASTKGMPLALYMVIHG